MNGVAVRLVQRAIHALHTQNHLWVAHEITVDAGLPIILGKEISLNPIRQALVFLEALLHEEHVGHDFRASVFLEGIVRQAHGCEQVEMTSQPGADAAIFFIQCVARGDECQHAAWS